MNLENPITLLLIIGCAIVGGVALSRLELRIGRSKWIDRMAGVIGLVIFTAAVMLAGVYAGAVGG